MESSYSARVSPDEPLEIIFTLSSLVLSDLQHLLQALP